MEKLLEFKEYLFEKKYYMIGGIVFLILLGCSSYFCYQKLTNERNEVVFIEEENQEEMKEEKKEECYVSVDIKGEVITPGLYKMSCDSRVQDVINEAGGITKSGDTTILNLGKKVIDEMVIIVYSKKEVDSFATIKEEENKKIESCINHTEIINDACIENDDLVNQVVNNNSNISNEIISDTPVKVLVSINNGTKEELMTLSGIGESKANYIINYRTEMGGFKSLEEIKNVKGIGDSIFEKIKDDITL